MRLYHFTQLECVIGNSGLATVAARIKANGGHADMTREDAAPGSIWHSGLLPHLDEDQRPGFPLAIATAGMAHRQSSNASRIFLLSRSAAHPYHSVSGQALEALGEIRPPACAELELWRSIAPPLLCEAERWYVYFGTVAPDRITGLEFTEEGGKAKSKEQLDLLPASHNPQPLALGAFAARTGSPRAGGGSTAKKLGGHFP